MNTLDWDDVRLFLALVQAGTVRAAGKVLQIHHSTVARRLDAMEDRLQVALFSRRSRGLVLTPAGEDLVGAAERVAEEMAGIERRLAGHDQQVSGLVRLTMPDAIATNFLLDGLADFLLANPLLELELLPGNALLDLGRGEADIAIRVTDTPPDHLIGRPLGRVAMSAYASPAYLARWPASGSLAGARWLGWGDGHAEGHRAAMGLPDLPVWGRFSSVLLQQAGAAAGVGIGELPCMLAESDPRLVPVPGAATVPGTMVWLLAHPELRRSARVRSLMQAITAVFANRADEFRQDLPVAATA